MYFGDYDMYDICEKLELDMNTLRFYVFGETGSGSNEACWFQLKKKLNPTSVSIYIKDKINVLDKTAGIALNIVNESLRRLQSTMLEDTSFQLSIDDTRKLASIVVDMDKMVRLESGKATDIIDTISGLSVADARRILLEDPFAPEIIEADWGELEADEGKESSEEIENKLKDLKEQSGLDDDGFSTIEVSKDLRAVKRPWDIKD